MIRIKKYAAIDIGSNAVRLLIADIIENDENDKVKFKKSALVRVPIRLGEDTFGVGEISEKNIMRLTDAMNAFQLLMSVHKVEKYKACATSAMRDASNGEYVINRILKKTGIKIDIIDGEIEAQIIAATDLGELLDNSKSYLYVDVGGGSTEMTIYKKGEIANSRSFKVGTVRMLNQKDALSGIWEEMKDWVKHNTKGIKNISLIGSGGNINKIYKMSGRTDGSPLSFIYMKANYKYLKAMTYDERISELNLNQDRADVIIPATKIYVSAMKWSDAKKIYVPKIGLSDGIVKSLYAGIIE
ncbi:Ppx/GppA phosphatase family protein [Wenyingzhuangia marina]|uniref:Exopolyphosphatase / guanosine-5'-triphosphate,3'-diphosphate pyrophosphatase n=1 Tax=Wenyingzhuangia marina TaxID=1195760 RepID=A0A1M5UFC5_9FLAO|nr:exopolyphosphatase [Wenyingzhuangia marina]GGF68100.1 exopolyphosphatase [Wenyingzhuangia marina]SHH61536.1 exopolyphosphatase / guanosine-5'-triphosphate,3'-diphosphate pyrophosphatase [Wenyingzhuangia marina]